MIRLAVLSRMLARDGRYETFLIDPLLRLEGPLRDHGVALVEQAPDVLLVDIEQTEGIDPGLPLILFDRSDGAPLWWHGTGRVDEALRWLRAPQVRGMIKVCRYTGGALYNTPWVGGAYHLHRVHEATPEAFPAWKPVAFPEVTESDLAKIELGYGYWAFGECDWLSGRIIDLEAPRSIDVSCAATVDYASPLVRHHRSLALERVQQLRGVRTVVGRGRVVEHAAYCQLLCNCRICVAPWGWGETTIREYEAMLAGCVVIKPRTDFIESYPTFDERHYIPCAVDFSDLPEKAADVLAHWDRYTALRHANRELVLALRQPETLAGRMASLVRRMLERTE